MTALLPKSTSLWSPEARTLARVLLSHHREVVRRPGAPENSILISYRELFDAAGLPHLASNPGPWLREVAAWCHDNGWPPINALAVNHRSRRPGPGYDNAPGCSLSDWAKELDACIRFTGYPDTLDR